MRRRLVLAILGVVFAGAAVVPVAAQEAPSPAGSLTDLTGEWVMELAGHQMGL